MMTGWRVGGKRRKIKKKKLYKNVSLILHQLWLCNVLPSSYATSLNAQTKKKKAIGKKPMHLEKSDLHYLMGSIIFHLRSQMCTPFKDIIFCMGQ